MKKAEQLMKKALADNVFPGAVLLVAKENSLVFFKSYGLANIFSKKKVNKNTIFDLASLTKPLATTLGIMVLAQEGKLSLSQKIKAFIPEFGQTDKSDISIKNLLLHNSGLKDYLPYYKELRNISFEDRQQALRDKLLKEPVLYPPGENVLYSDLGFMILNWIIETLSKMRLDRFLIQNVYKPCGIDYINGLFFIDPERDVKRNKFAATEFCPWRNTLIEGAVHDENAFALGGIEGHSGLFGNAQNIYKLLSYLLSAYHGKDDLNIFSQNITQMFLKRKRHDLRALGFDVPAEKNSSAGKYFSKTSVGHLGFTGTSFWMDLEKAIIIILLTNRVHPTRENVKIRDFRPILHDAIMESLIQ